MSVLSGRRSVRLFVSAAKSVSPLSTTTVSLPKRVQRGPTDLLEALATTVGDDCTAPKYSFHDDPFFIPLSGGAKRSYALGREAGATAARYFAKEFPTLFMMDNDEPRIGAYRPSKLPKTETECTEEALIDRMRKLHLDAAIVVYNNAVSSKVQLSSESVHSLLELLCYYNCLQPNLDFSTVQRWFLEQHGADSGVNSVWQENGAAEKVFASIEPKTPRAYSAMICGMLKYHAYKKAETLFNEMSELGLIPDRRVYNSMLSSVCRLRMGHHDRWAYILNLLQALHDAGVQPNAHTFDAALFSLRQMRFWRSAPTKALSIFQEMLAVDLEPTLGTYTALLDIFDKYTELPSLIEQVIARLDGKHLKVETAMDSLLFPKLMQRCYEVADSMEPVNQIHSILCYGNNSNCLTSFHAETLYYENYLSAVCRHANSFEHFFDVYERIVPKYYSPSIRFTLLLLDTVDMTGAYRWLPRIWSEIVRGQMATRSSILDRFFQVTVDGSKDCDQSLGLALLTAVQDAYKRIVSIFEPSDRRGRLPPGLTLTADLLARMALTASYCGRPVDAWQIANILICKFDNNDDDESTQLSPAEKRMQDCLDGRPAVDVLKCLLINLISVDKLDHCRRLLNTIQAADANTTVDSLLNDNSLTTDQSAALRLLNGQE